MTEGRRNRRAKKGKKKRGLFITIFLILTIIIGGAAFGFSRLGRMKREELPQNDADLGIIKTEEKSVYDINKENKDVINIVLYGVDSRKDNFSDRSDSIMVVSIDKKNQTLKVTSLMRDMKVDIPGRKADKLNHAYAFGGAALSIKTINTNFDLNVRDFVTINFFGLEKIIDKVGGVNINVSEKETEYLNGYLNELNSLHKENVPNVNPGKQVLNGRQAVAYSRIRYVGGDYERTQRQREILNELFRKIKARGAVKLPGLIDAMLPYVETSLSNGDILSLGQEILKYNVGSIEQLRLPADGKFTSQNTYLVPDLEANKKILHDFIYGVK